MYLHRIGVLYVMLPSTYMEFIHGPDQVVKWFVSVGPTH